MIDFVASSWPRILNLTYQHLWLSVLGVVLAMIVSIPLGVLLTRSKGLKASVLGVVDIIQTVPSLALLALLMMVLGIGNGTLVAGLFLYSLLPLARNTVAGIEGVDPSLIEASRGMGMTEFQTLVKVKLPLAVPVILAGVRVALVTAIGITTIGVLFGAGGLGAIIMRGIQLSGGGGMVLAGAIPAALLAVLADWVLSLVERWLTPHAQQG